LQHILVLVLFVDTTDETVARTKLAEIFAVGPVVEHVQIHSYADQNQLANAMSTHGDRKYMKGFAFRYLSVDLVQYVFEQVSAFLKVMGPEDAGSAVLLEAYPTGKQASIPSDATAFANRGDFFNSAMIMRWKSPEKDAYVRDWIKTFIAGAKELEKRMATNKKESFVEGGYANFNMEDDKIEEAFKGNLPRLKEVKKKWDPKGRFNKWFAIRPA
jgi:Berberine and berberine like